MKTTFFSLLLFSCLFCSCVSINSINGNNHANTGSQFLVSIGQIGLVKQVMTVQDVLDLYPPESIKKVIGEGEFAEDQHDDYQLYDSENRHTLTFTPARNNDLQSKISTVVIHDVRFKTEKGIGLSSTYGQLTEAYGTMDHSPDMETIHISVTKLKARFSIQKSDLEEGWWNDSKKEIDASKIPPNTKLSGFLIQWQ